MGYRFHTRGDIHLPDMTKYQLVAHLSYHHRHENEITASVRSFLSRERTKKELVEFHDRLHGLTTEGHGTVPSDQ